MPRTLRPPRLVAPLLLVSSLLAVPLRAGSLPTHRAPVMDDAMLLQTAHRIELARRLAELERTAGIELAVLTVPRLADFGFDKARGEAFATALFNSWQLGDRTTNKGVLVLVSKEDRFVRIELGAGWGRTKDASMKWAIDHVFVPRFRAGEYSLGVLGGTKAVIEALTGHPREASAPREPVERSGPGAAGIGSDPVVQGFAFLLLVSLALAVADSFLHGTRGLGWGYLTLLGTALFFVFSIFLLFGRPRRRGFGGGGGFSMGGGASGSW